MEDLLSQILVILLKRISVRTLLDDEMESTCMYQEDLKRVFLPYMKQYSDTELHHMLSAVNDILKSYMEFDGTVHARRGEISLFNAIFNFTDQMLVEQENEVLCRYDKILRWRNVVSQISEETFVMAFMAKKDVAYGVRCKHFANKPVIGHNNMQLNAILNSGMSENHFHLMGSAPYFQLSWIQLMNDIRGNDTVKKLRQFEKNRRNVNIMYQHTYLEESFAVRLRQAFLIRLYLYARLKGIKIQLRRYQVRVENCVFQFEEHPELLFYRVNWKKIEKQEKICTVRETVPENRRQEQSPEEKEKVYTILELLEACWGKEAFQAFRAQQFLTYQFMEYLCDQSLSLSIFKEEPDEISVARLLTGYVKARKFIDLERCGNFLEPRVYDVLWEQETLKAVRYFMGNDHGLMLAVPDLQCMVHSIRYAGKHQAGDYAFDLSDYEWYEQHGRYIDLWGERNFLYQCFREICNKGYLFSHYESNLFHAYLVIKENMRSEMVQANAYVGFENFQVHQDRKDLFSSGLRFDRSMARMAVRDTLQSQNIIRLEARISLAESARRNYDNIRFYDHAIDEKEEMRERFYYVFHFIKSKDDWKSSGTGKPEQYLKRPDRKSGDGPNGFQVMKPRHNRKRRDVEKRAGALKAFREQYPTTASRVLGIDAASQEIGCRPEVFATAFRFLKSHTFSYGVGSKKLLPQLRISYHVGEDFLDVADGLRAIDEALSFLDMDCGDRLGHALALGIDVKEWYASKGNELSIPAQDYLDNVVWLYRTMVRYRIEDSENLKSYLGQEFSYYFHKIYGSAILQEEIDRIAGAVREKYQDEATQGNTYYLYQQEHMLLSFDIDTYCRAWQIRGDDPELYIKGFYDRRHQAEYYGKTHRVNKRYPRDFTIRYVPEVAYLYYLYHYSPKVREEGRKDIEYKVFPALVRGVQAVQKELQKKVAKKGISIETNPTSNYMIGTFKRYAKHPILQFYNNGLVTDEKKRKACPQIWSSINTDDQGVFAASLENEYALMARALEKETDENGNEIYNKTQIYEWIDHIRMNGNRQSFGIIKRN